VAALVALEQGPRLRGAVGPPADVAELGPAVDEGAAQALAAHRHRRPGQLRGGPAEAPLLGRPGHLGHGRADRHGQQQPDADPGETARPAQLVDPAPGPGHRDPTASPARAAAHQVSTAAPSLAARRLVQGAIGRSGAAVRSAGPAGLAQRQKTWSITWSSLIARRAGGARCRDTSRLAR
jgi:hypothetical protein